MPVAASAGSAEKWLVKGVPSGDTLVLFQPDPKGPMPPKEKTIVMSNLQCPKCARRPKDGGATPDDEWGWQAREFIRKKVIGRPVMFTKEATNDVSGREYGKVLYKDGADGQPKDLAAELVAHGFASGRDGARAAGLVEAEKTAITEKRGKYGDNAQKEGTPRALKWDPPAQYVLDVYTKKKGQKFQAQIDHVISGHIYKVLMLPEMQLMMVNLSGIKCANERKTQGEFGVEARCLAERFLLHREVCLTIEGKDKFDNVLCTVTAGPNVFQEELLKNGLAKIFDPTISESTFRDRLRAAEAAAKQAQRNLWKGYVAPVVSDKGGKKEEGEAVQLMADFTGQVMQVQTPDTLFIRNEAGEKVKVALASCRGGAEKTAEGAPSRLAKIERQVGAAHGRADGEGLILYHNLFWEGREFLRKELVGKQVKVEVDYMMNIPIPGQEEKEVRPAVTITYDEDKVANMELIKSGMAIVMGSRDGVCRHMDKLRDLMADAQEQKRGGWSGKPMPTLTVREMSRPQAKTGTALLGAFKRAGAGSGAGVPRLRGVVEFVLAANRVKVFIEREKCQVSLNMAGIATPSTGFQGEEPDALAPEALAFAEQNLLQRDVDIQFEAFVNGSFIGNLFVNEKSFAVTLLSEGFATMEGQNLQSMTCKAEADQAEAKAKKEKKGIWSPSASIPKRAQQQKGAWTSGGGLTATPAEAAKPATITEIIDSGRFWFQERTKAVGGALQTIEQTLKKLALDAKPPPNSVRPGEFVAAKFSADKEWYRARVVKPFGVGKCEVLFIDYGNKEVTPLSQIRKMPELDESVKKCPGLAQEAYMAFTQAIAVGENFGNESALCLKEYGSSVTVKQEYTEGKLKYYTVAMDGQMSCQEEMLMRGYTYVRRDLEGEESLTAQIAPMLKAQAKASSARTGMWRYGDPRGDDQDDYRHVGRYNN